MKKRFLALMLAVVLCFVLTACSSGSKGGGHIPDDPDVTETKSDTTKPDITKPDTTKPVEAVYPEGPILYKVSDGEGNVIWLFGSIHIGREDYYPLPDYVLDAFDSSDALAVEANVVAFESDISGQMNALQKLVYTDGTTIKDHVSEETYSAAVDILKENGIYSSMFDYYMPSMWFSLIESCAVLNLDIDTQLGVDIHLINRAMDADKEILEIESAEFQYGMLSEFSPELQVYLLESTIETYSQTKLLEQSYKAMMDAWASGDEKVLIRLIGAEGEIEDEKEAELYEEYNEAMIEERNESMTDYAVDALESGEEVFICVGAAHVIGDDAIADNLRELGYTVERVAE